MNRTERNAVKAALALERAEKQMIRAFNRWQKVRAQVSRYARKTERGEIGGGYDVRELVERK